MMSPETIISLARAAAVRAFALEMQPYVPASTVEVANYSRFPFPNLGSYRPTDWTLTEWVTADATGMGYESEPALTVRGLKAWVVQQMEADPTVGFGIIETGQFQVVVGCFSQDPDAVAEEGDYGESEEYKWVECPSCAEPVEEKEDWCPWCDASMKDDDEDDDYEEETERSDTWAEGLEAYELGKGRGENPYDGGSQEYLDWDDGWTAGKGAEHTRMCSEDQPNFLE